MTVRIDLDLRDAVGPELDRLMLRSGQLSRVLDEIGGSLETSTQHRFEEQRDPEGRPWKRLADATRARKRGPGILREQIDLYDSIGHSPPASGKVLVGANRTYARIHQLGGQAGRGRKVTIPARPYLGVSEADRREIVAIVRDHLEH